MRLLDLLMLTGMLCVLEELGSSRESAEQDLRPNEELAGEGDRHGTQHATRFNSSHQSRSQGQRLLGNELRFLFCNLALHLRHHITYDALRYTYSTGYCVC